MSTSGGWRYQKTREEMEASLARASTNLRSSAAAFDTGSLAAAELIAGVVYVICYDGNSRTRSLLTQLGIKDHMRFPDSSRHLPKPDPGVATMGPPLLGMRTSSDGAVEWGAPASDSNPDLMEWRAFSRWWDEKVYVSTHTGAHLSRKQLVNTLRSQDGGGHVDDTLGNEAYYSLSRAGDHISTNEEQTLATSSGSIPNAHWHTMRQIAWELDQALIRRGF